MSTIQKLKGKANFGDFVSILYILCFLALPFLYVVWEQIEFEKEPTHFVESFKIKDFYQTKEYQFPQEYQFLEDQEQEVTKRI